MKKTNKRLGGARRSVHANLSTANHARLLRHAEATNLSASKYVGVAAEFLLDLEDAFGGPLTDQFRRMMVQSAGRAQGVLKKVFS
jgi:hypothetical protein